MGWVDVTTSLPRECTTAKIKKKKKRSAAWEIFESPVEAQDLSLPPAKPSVFAVWPAGLEDDEQQVSESQTAHAEFHTVPQTYGVHLQLLKIRLFYFPTNLRARENTLYILWLSWICSKSWIVKTKYLIAPSCGVIDISRLDYVVTFAAHLCKGIPDSLYLLFVYCFYLSCGWNLTESFTLQETGQDFFDANCEVRSSLSEQLWFIVSVGKCLKK